MKKIILTIALFALSTMAIAQRKEIPPRADSVFKHIMSSARPAVTGWVKTTAAKYRGTEFTEEKARAEATNAVKAIPGMANADIEALAFLVMMQSAKASGEDMKGIMAEVKTINDAKATQRGAAAQTSVQRTAAPVVKKDSIRSIQASPALQQKIKADKADAVTDMNEPQQLKLQAAIDSRNRMIETISNLLKKMDETEQSIIGNLK